MIVNRYTKLTANYIFSENYSLNNTDDVVQIA